MRYKINLKRYNSQQRYRRLIESFWDMVELLACIHTYNIFCIEFSRTSKATLGQHLRRGYCRSIVGGEDCYVFKKSVAF